MFITAVNVKHDKIEASESVTIKPKTGAWTILSSKTKKDLQDMQKKLKKSFDIGKGTIIEI